MKRKTFYELLITLAVALVFVSVGIRVSEILQEDKRMKLAAAQPLPSGETAQYIADDDKGTGIVRLYGKTIKEYANKYNLDWRLVLAVIRQESRFSIDAESQRGALGLMQIMPTTFEDIAESMGLEDIMNPKANIVAGIKHLATLSESFQALDPEDCTRLTLASYNAGIGRILDAQHLAEFLNDDPNTWEGVRDALPLLSRRFSTLHGRAWENDHPKNGYFNDYRQTVDYVDHVMAYYKDYCRQYQ